LVQIAADGTIVPAPKNSNDNHHPERW
jgi:hypothetical protein